MLIRIITCSSAIFFHIERNRNFHTSHWERTHHIWKFFRVFHNFFILFKHNSFFKNNSTQITNHIRLQRGRRRASWSSVDQQTVLYYIELVTCDSYLTLLHVTVWYKPLKMKRVRLRNRCRFQDCVSTVAFCIVGTSSRGSMCLLDPNAITHHQRRHWLCTYLTFRSELLVSSSFVKRQLRAPYRSAYSGNGSRPRDVTYTGNNLYDAMQLRSYMALTDDTTRHDFQGRWLVSHVIRPSFDSSGVTVRHGANVINKLTKWIASRSSVVAKQLALNPCNKRAICWRGQR